MNRGTLGSRSGLQVIDIRSSLRLTYGIPCIFNEVRPNPPQEFYAGSGDFALQIFLHATRLNGLFHFDLRRSIASEVDALFAGQINMLTILVVILLLVALGALPTWPHSRSWGYYPSGGLGLVVLVLVILLLLGRI